MNSIGVALISAFIPVIISCQKNTIDYDIDIWISDYSLATSVRYHIKQDSVVIVRQSDLVDEVPQFLFERAFKAAEIKEFYDFIKEFKIDSLRESYEDPNIDDGEIIKFKIRLKTAEKYIVVSNYHQEQLYSLVQQVNLLLPEKYEIKYSSPKM